MKKPLHVLVVEDRPADVELLVHQLTRAGFDPDCARVDTEAAFVSHLDPPPDVILSDYSMPRFSAERALEILNERGEGTPFIVVSGTVGEDAAVAMMRHGADDYVLKDRLARLGEAIRNAIERRRLLREREEAVRALADREERLRQLVEQTSAVLWTVDADLRITSARGGRLVAFGPRSEELVGVTLEEYFGSSGVAEVAIAAHRRALSGHSASYEHPRTDRIFEARLEPLREPEGAIVGVVGVALDVTDRKEAEEKMWRTEEQRRKLLSRLLTAQEEERQLIANDLHDDSIQVIAAVGMELGALRNRVDPGLAPRFEELERVVGEAITRLRRMMFELVPPALSREGVVAALREHLEHLEEKEGIECALDDRLPREPPMEARAVLYRIAREALTNVRKHAGARRVEVRLQASEGGVLVRIRDDGSGFSPSETRGSPNGHFGLTSMRERAELAGGWWRVDSAEGRGTAVEFWIPQEGST